MDRQRGTKQPFYVSQGEIRIKREARNVPVIFYALRHILEADKLDK